MKGMWLHKAPSSPVLLRDPARFFHPPASVVVGDEEGTYILMSELDSRLQLKETFGPTESRMSGSQ